MNVQEYLTTGAATKGDLLIVKTIYDRLIEAATKKRIGRGEAAFILGPGDIPGGDISIDLVTPDSSKMRKVAEGAGIPIDTVEYTSVTATPVKYAMRPLITKEMQEDGKWNLIMHNIKIAGIEAGENEDALIVADALDKADQTVSGSGAITIANITRGMQYLEDEDYTATTFFIGPEILNDLRNIDTFVEADKLGSTEMLDKGIIGRLFAMDVRLISAKLMTSAYAYIIDREHAFCIAEKRPLTISQYDDVTHDLSGAVITTRIAVRTLRTKAINKITT